MALTGARCDGHFAAIIASSATGVAGLYLTASPDDDGVLTCVDPELEHQSLAKSIPQAVGIHPNRQRPLSSWPLGVMGRLAADPHDLVYLGIAPAILRVAREGAWLLLRSGGMLALTDALFDGIITDSSRTDHDTVAVREADEYMLQLDDVFVIYLPLTADTTVLVGKQFSAADRIAGDRGPM